MNDQSRQSRINHDTARMWVNIIRKTLRGETINAETRAEQACGHWQRTARRKASMLRGNWAMTPTDYYSRHEHREPLTKRERVVFAVAFIVFVALCAVQSS